MLLFSDSLTNELKTVLICIIYIQCARTVYIYTPRAQSNDCTMLHAHPTLISGRMNPNWGRAHFAKFAKICRVLLSLPSFAKFANFCQVCLCKVCQDLPSLQCLPCLPSSTSFAKFAYAKFAKICQVCHVCQVLQNFSLDRIANMGKTWASQTMAKYGYLQTYAKHGDLPILVLPNNGTTTASANICKAWASCIKSSSASSLIQTK